MGNVDKYPGVYEGKQVATKIMVKSMRLMGGESNFHNTHHVGLAGWDAGEIQAIVKESNNCIPAKLLHAAESQSSRVVAAQSAISHIIAPSEWRNKGVFPGDFFNMIEYRKLHGKIGNMSLDTCETIDSCIDFLTQSIRLLNVGGVVSINITYARDGLRNDRHIWRPTLTSQYRCSTHWKAIATAKVLSRLLATQGTPIFFGLALAYSNNGEGKEGVDSRSVAAPMLTLVGKKMKQGSREATEPAYFMRLGYGGEVAYVRRSEQHFGHRAHLPEDFKTHWNNLYATMP